MQIGKNKKAKKTQEEENLSEQEKLTREIAKLNERIRRSNKYHNVFVRGIIQGVGTVLGATIIAGLVFAFLSMILESAGAIPILDVIILDRLEQIIDESQSTK